MLVKTKLSPAGMTRVMEKLNSRYEGNMLYRDWQDKGKMKDGRNRYRFTLRVRNSRGPGARLSARGNRTVNASWQAHRDFYRALYDHDDKAVVETSLITYKDATDFEANHHVTYDTNMGSMMAPAMLGDLEGESE